MSNDNQILIQIETMQKIIKELNQISILCSEPHLKMKIEGLQRYVSSVIEWDNKISTEDLIYEKMVEVKYDNPDLHLKLYMLYRDLMSGRISKIDAMSSYESCLRLFNLDDMVY